MRNLKRALSLVMAAAMLIGMMVVGASAAGVTSIEEFPDYASIVNTEAVSTLVNLNVINGKDTGYFAPQDNVTRAEMCKMIAIVRSGGNDNISGTTSTTNFTDVPSTYWAAAYIEYCASLDIVAGRGGGIFDPDANITGSECAKMLLVAMEYNAEAFKLTGATWEANVNTWAVNKDANLYDGLNINYSAIINRDNAARMIYNALNAYVMTYTIKTGSTTGIEREYGLSSITMLEKYYKASKVSGVVISNEFTDGSALSGKTTLSYMEGNSSFNGSVFKISTSADTLGKRVTFYAVPATSSTSSEKATIIGNVIVSDDDNTVFETGMGYTGSSAESDLKKDLSKAGLKFKDVDDLSINESNKANKNDGVLFYINYYDATDARINDFATAVKSVIGATAGNVINSTSTNYNPLTLEELALYMTGAGITVRFIDNDGDGTIDVVLFVAKAFGKISTVSTTGDGKLQVANTDMGTFSTYVKTLNSKDAYNDVYDFENLSVAKNDYVTYYEVNGTWYVDVVDSETTTVTSAKSTSLKIDGTTHDLSILTLQAFNKDRNLGSVSTKSKVKVYYDDYSNILLVDADTADKDYLMVTSPKTFTVGYDDTQQMKVIFADATTATIEVETIDGDNVEDYTSTATAASMVATDVIYEYSENSNGTYDLTSQTTVDLSSASNTGGITITKGKSAIASGAAIVGSTNTTAVSANSSTAFVVKSSSSSTWKFYTGISNMPTTTITTGYAVLDSDSTTAEAVFINSSSSIAGAEDYIVILSTDFSTNTSKNYGYQAFYQDLFYIDGEKSEILIDSKNLKLGVYVGTSGSADDVVSVGTYYAPQAIANYSDDTLTFSTGTSGGNTQEEEYGIEDAVIYLIDSDGSYDIGNTSDLKGATKVSVIAKGADGANKYAAAYIFIF